MKKMFIVCMLLMVTMMITSCKDVSTEETTDVDTTSVYTPETVETTTTTTVEVDTLSATE